MQKLEFFDTSPLFRVSVLDSKREPILGFGVIIESPFDEEVRKFYENRPERPIRRWRRPPRRWGPKDETNPT